MPGNLLIDHTELFSEHTYEPPTDYARTNGLLEHIRQGDFQRRYRAVSGENR